MDDPDESVEWVLTRVNGLQYRKQRTVRVGDAILTSRTRPKGRAGEGKDAEDAAEQVLPRRWLRLVTQFQTLLQLGVSRAQERHFLHCATRALQFDEPRQCLDLLSLRRFGARRVMDGQRRGPFSVEEEEVLREALLVEQRRRQEGERPFRSLADSSNRQRDRRRVENTHFIPELGFEGCGVAFYNANNDDELVATGYERVVYGDHGPYLEFRREQLNWDALLERDEKGASVAYYDELHTKDGEVKVYVQRKTVHDVPNPPPGKYSERHNRAEGYADYRVGYLYVSLDDLSVGGVHCMHWGEHPDEVPFLYLLSQRGDLQRARRGGRGGRNKPGKSSRGGKAGRVRGARRGREPKSSAYGLGSYAPRAHSCKFQGVADDTGKPPKRRNREENEEKSGGALDEEEEKHSATSSAQDVRRMPEPQSKTTQQRKDGGRESAKMRAPRVTRAPKLRTKEALRVVQECLDGQYVPGLIYIPDFISEEEQRGIGEDLCQHPEWWEEAGRQQRRRTLQFGWHLDYKELELYRAHGVFARIPRCWDWLVDRIQGEMRDRFGRECHRVNQLIVNEYLPSHGIAPHTDRTNTFGPVVCGLSLFSPCVIEFKRGSEQWKRNAPTFPVLLPPRSLYIMSGPSRYEYVHGISREPEQRFFGHMIRRTTRFSLTFRHAVEASSETFHGASYNPVSAKAMDMEVMP